MRMLLIGLIVGIGACERSLSAEDVIDCSRQGTEPSLRVEACSRSLASQDPSSAGYAAAVAWRGQAKEALADWAGAQRDYEESLAIAPHLGGTMLGLGRVHLAQGDLESARRYLNLAIEENDSGIARDLLGSYALSQRDYVGALAEYEALLASQPDNAIGLYGRGLARLGMGDERGFDDVGQARAAWENVDSHFERQGLAAP